jgi:hypothetical protein
VTSKEREKGGVGERERLEVREGESGRGREKVRETLKGQITMKTQKFL